MNLDITTWCKLALISACGIGAFVIVFLLLVARGVHPSAVHVVASAALLSTVYTMANLMIGRHNRRVQRR